MKTKLIKKKQKSAEKQKRNLKKILFQRMKMNLSSCAQLEYVLLELLCKDGQSIRLEIEENSNDVVKAIKSCDYHYLSQQSFVILGKSDEIHNFKQLESVLTEHLNSLHLEGKWELFGKMIACLQLFVQINFTGRLEEKSNHNLVTEKLAQSLQLDGENVVPVVKNLELFLLPKVFFNLGTQIEPLFCTLAFKWWKFRCLWVHQQLLEERSEIIFNEVEALLEVIDTSCLNTQGKVHFALEKSTFFMGYFHVNKIKDAVTVACELAGIKVEETGKLGKRTKFQHKELAQFTLNIESTNSDLDFGDKVETIKSDLPQDLKLDDEVRLDKIKFSEARDLNPLSTVHCGIILSKYYLLKRSQPKDSLFKEELFPYLDAILENPYTNWSLRSVALLGKITNALINS